MADFKDLAIRYDNPWIRALVQAVPIAGGAADTLIAAAVDRIHQDRARRFFDELASGAQALDQAIVESEPFLHAYFATLKAALSARQREKTEYLARLLAAGTRGEIAYGDEHEELLGIVEETSLAELHTIARLRDIEDYECPRAWYEGGVPESDIQHTMRLWPQFMNSFGAVPSEMVRARLARLGRTGLYEPLTGNWFGYEGGMGRSTLMYRHLAAVIHLRKRAVRGYGPGAVALNVMRFDRRNSDFKDRSVGEHTAIWEVSGTLQIAEDAEPLRRASIRFEVLESSGQVTNGIVVISDVSSDRPTPFRLTFSDRVYSGNHRARLRVEGVE